MTAIQKGKDIEMQTMSRRASSGESLLSARGQFADQVLVANGQSPADPAEGRGAARLV